jgi:small subunit ribosomal protein S7
MPQKEFLYLTKLLNILIKKGKKDKALKMLLLLLKNLKNSNIENYTSLEIIYQALLNVRPLLHTQKVRKSSKVFYLPKIITTEKKMSIALQWIVKSVNARKERKLSDRLTNEFLDCFYSKGLTILKKQNLYDTISVNRPFLHLLVYK